VEPPSRPEAVAWGTMRGSRCGYTRSRHRVAGVRGQQTGVSRATGGGPAGVAGGAGGESARGGRLPRLTCSGDSRWPFPSVTSRHMMKAAALLSGEDPGMAAAESCATAEDGFGRGCPISCCHRRICRSCWRASMEVRTAVVNHLHSVVAGFNSPSLTVQTTSASSRSGRSWTPSGFTPRAVNLVGVELNVRAVAPSAGAG
jgi:hypothetical protein